MLNQSQNLDLLGLTQEGYVPEVEADAGEALMATFEAGEYEADINGLIATQEQLDAQTLVAEKIIVASSKSGLSSDTVDALHLAVEALEVSSTIMPKGYITQEGETFDKVKNFIKSMIKSVQIFFQKFVQMVGKWVKKLGTFLTASDKTREKIQEDIAGWTDAGKSGLVAKAPSTWFANNAFGAAIHSYRNPGNTAIENVTPTNLGNDYKLNGLGSATIRETIVVKHLRHGGFGIVIEDSKGNIKTLTATLSASAKNVVKPTSHTVDGKTQKGVTLGVISDYIHVEAFEGVLGSTAKDMRGNIDDDYKDVIDARDGFTSDIKDTDDRAEAIKLKTKSLAVSKLTYKSLGASVGMWKDAITIARVIATAMKVGTKSVTKLTDTELLAEQNTLNSMSSNTRSPSEAKRLAEVTAEITSRANNTTP